MNGYGTGLRGVKSQKIGYGNGFGAGAFPELGPQPGPGGVKPQKAIYSNGLGTGTFPEVQQTGFPGAGSYPANGYNNGYGAGGPGYPKPSLYENGLYGQLKPEPVPGTYGGPDMKHNFNGFLGNGYRGRCPPGKC
ncbi:glycine rich extracellular protein 1 isoform X2 [Antechinus flavipes]|uniref:glycine rich extracellular protein 1 isoform X2 n=1 Tax=Antechinus flavipes TaxID=38775 RepID=UPI002235B271|nr:glycine rich extracellular protein 1 isoform X2 [Antechinus flavipes]